MDDVVIRAEGLGKKYVLGAGAGPRENYSSLRDELARGIQSLGQSFSRSKKAAADEFWALRDLSFAIKRGEVVGIIGRNGAGKSTLLKVLSRITEPTTGRVQIHGRVASLLEVGTGFHPELTGRENVYLNGAILGMTRAEIRRKFDEIVAFAEVEKFLDTPVKRYSSGMYVRLAFAVAAHLEPEILVVDEVLAVGDAEFQKKCLGKMQDVSSRGRTVLFVSHNVSAMRTLCPTSIYLEAGSLRSQGSTEEVIEQYLQSWRGIQGANDGKARLDGDEDTTISIELGASTISPGEPLNIDIEVNCLDRGQLIECAILFYTATGVRLGVCDLRSTGVIPLSNRPGRTVVRVAIPSIPFIEGDYVIGLYACTSRFRGDLRDLATFRVTPVVEASSSGYVPYPSDARGYVAIAGVAHVERVV